MAHPSVNPGSQQPIVPPSASQQVTQPAPKLATTGIQQASQGGLARSGNTEFVPGAYASMGHPLIDRMLELETALKLNRTAW